MRPFNAYGERQNASAYAGLIPVVIRRVLAGEPVVVNGDGEQTRDMTHVSDTVRGRARAGRTGASCPAGVSNLGHGTEVSVNEMVRYAPRRARREAITRCSTAPNDPATSAACWRTSAAAREAVGYEPLVSVADGFARTVRWYLSASATVSTSSSAMP